MPMFTTNIDVSNAELCALLESRTDAARKELVSHAMSPGMTGELLRTLTDIARTERLFWAMPGDPTYTLCTFGFCASERKAIAEWLELRIAEGQYVSGRAADWVRELQRARPILS